MTHSTQAELGKPPEKTSSGRDSSYTPGMSKDVAPRVGQFFNRRARQFDRIYREGTSIERLLNRTLRRMIYERSEALLEEVCRLGSPTLLDVGCGSGVNALAAIEKGASRAHGVDLAEDMIVIARERATEAALSDNCDFELGDFMTWSKTEQFDVVAALGVFDYVADSRAFFEKMASLARRSVVASFPGRTYRGMIRKVRYELRGCPLYLYDKETVSTWAKDAGLTPRFTRQDASGFVLVADR